MGRGLLWADGTDYTCWRIYVFDMTLSLADIHKRQRKVMLPGFGGEIASKLYGLITNLF